MSQIEVAKLVQYVFIAPPSDGMSVPKLVMHAWLMPGDDGSVVAADRQAHVYAQKITRG